VKAARGENWRFSTTTTSSDGKETEKTEKQMALMLEKDLDMSFSDFKWWTTPAA
jgi:hypothetical protein